MLKEELDENVGYVFLNKNYSLDLQAFGKLREFVKSEQIDLVHAHGTSWYWGVLLKISGLKIKLVWHDHYGESEQLEERDVKYLKPLSRYFDGIIAVNGDLKDWAKEKLKCDKIIQLNNFIVPSKIGDSQLRLKGDPKDFKIICVANLRPQKDHLNLLAAFDMLKIEEISLHLIGSDPGTTYSQTLKMEITKSDKKIFYYGSSSSVFGLLEQADLGVLSSRSEGLPLTLLEYGLVGLPVVCTEVGQCRELVGDEALLVPPSNAQALERALRFYFQNPETRENDAYRLHQKLNKNYSKETVLPMLFNFYNNISVT
ncbi:hypothetical protein APR41_12125 [Salegentibacter salinarum]|uniref:Glycosyltransferase n=2 Tax=Salegentibacter salinarum TaxID=447422 RepID=A0A2N0U2D3_9FLAO|nr:hypothetical protein APR41_12125 [Salegentibacter salinarum]